MGFDAEIAAVRLHHCYYLRAFTNLTHNPVIQVLYVTSFGQVALSAPGQEKVWERGEDKFRDRFRFVPGSGEFLGGDANERSAADEALQCRSEITRLITSALSIPESGYLTEKYS